MQCCLLTAWEVELAHYLNLLVLLLLCLYSWRKGRFLREAQVNQGPGRPCTMFPMKIKEESSQPYTSLTPYLPGTLFLSEHCGLPAEMCINLGRGKGTQVKGS